MRQYTRSLFFATLVICVSSALTPAQYREWLGAADVVPDRYTPVYGIRWNSGGFDQPRPNAERKSINKILANTPTTYPVGLAADFQARADAFPGTIESQIDARWGNAVARAQRCGITPPAPPYVVIRSTVWSLPDYPGLVIAGTTYPSLGYVAVVNLFPSSQGYVANAGDLAEWEFCNWILCRTVGCPVDIAHEGRFPCE